MTTSQQALNIILEQAVDLGTEEIPLQQATGRVLRESIYADRDFPPFNRISMDGIAIYYSAFQAGKRSFKVKGTVAAGSPLTSLEDQEACLEVMTGAIMPEGPDVVIPYEQVELENGIATIKIEDVKHFQNIHPKGFDRKEGDLLVEEGRVISPAEIGVCATVGKSTLKVSKLPKTLVISSGDELVDIDEQPLPHQIRKSNVHQITSTLRSMHLLVDTAHLADEYDSILEEITAYLDDYGLIILSGGVSKGKFDYIPKALEEAGVHKHFHRVEQRPGKPFWFGTKGQTAVFAFPGNPISSFACMQYYLKAWIMKSQQLANHILPYAKLAEDVPFRPYLTYFLQVKLEYQHDGSLLAIPVKGKGSGDLANLLDADALAVLPAGKDVYQKGEAYPLLIYR